MFNTRPASLRPATLLKKRLWYCFFFFGTKSEDPFILDYKSVEETVGAGCRKSKGNEKNEV